MVGDGEAAARHVGGGEIAGTGAPVRSSSLRPISSRLSAPASLTTGTTRPFSPSAVPTPMLIVGDRDPVFFPPPVDRRCDRHRFGGGLDDVGGVAELDALRRHGRLVRGDGEKSASNSAVTCGASLTARTMFSAIFSRIRSCGISAPAKWRGGRLRLAAADGGRRGHGSVDVVAGDAAIAAGAFDAWRGRCCAGVGRGGPRAKAGFAVPLRRPSPKSRLRRCGLESSQLGERDLGPAFVERRDRCGPAVRRAPPRRPCPAISRSALPPPATAPPA